MAIVYVYSHINIIEKEKGSVRGLGVRKETVVWRYERTGGTNMVNMHPLHL